MAHILITGINGYLGSRLAKRLSRDHEISGLEYRTDNLFRIAGEPWPVWPTEHGLPPEVFAGRQVDIVIHAATFYGRAGESPMTIATANLVRPMELLEQAIGNGVRLFVNTDTVLDRFVNAYALTKRHLQEWLYLRRNDIGVVNLQLEHFYGPDGSPANFVTAMIQRMSAHESPIDLTAGEQLRDFVFIDDVLDAYELVLSQSDLAQGYRHYEVASGVPVRLRDFVATIHRLTGSRSELRFGALPYRENELMESRANPQDLMELGWRPRISLEEGLKRCVTKG